MSIRVLQVFGVMNRGGAETMIMNIYRAIDRDNIQFDFVIHGNQIGAYDEEIKALGGKIFQAPKYTGKNHFKYKKWWKNFFIQNPEYKIVHSHVRSTASIILGLAKKYNCITISHSHNTSSGFGISSIVKNFLQRRIRYISDYFMGCSEAAGLWLFGKKICQSDRYFNVRNAIDVQKYCYSKNIADEVRKELGYTDSDYIIGHVGRFSEQKNHMFLLDIFNEALKKNENCKLLLVGGGERKWLIEKKINELGLQNHVQLVGVRKDVERMLMAMDVFLFPSKFEGLPVSVIEAQASGVSCVLSSTISKEVCITELVRLVSLKESCDNWSNIVLNCKTQHRVSPSEKIVSEGYDVSNSVIWLSQFYKKIIL